MSTELVFSKRLGDDYFEVRRIIYETPAEQGGFLRFTTRERYLYRVNGVRVSREVWTERKHAALDAFFAARKETA